jgi:hypothetical protein
VLTVSGSGRRPFLLGIADSFPEESGGGGWEVEGGGGGRRRTKGKKTSYMSVSSSTCYLFVKPPVFMVYMHMQFQSNCNPLKMNVI